MAGDSASSNLAVVIAALGLMLQVVAAFVWAWKSAKDKVDERSAESINKILQSISRIEAQMEEREKKYNENFSQLREEISKKRR